MIYNLGQIIEATALDFPDKIAFKCLDDSVTYAELNYKADQLASHLLENGLRKGDRVAVVMNRCLETSIAVYGILKAGGAFVAINPFSPLARIKAIIIDCGIQQLITTQTLTNKVTPIAKEPSLLKSIIGISKELSVKTTSWETVFSLSLERYTPPPILEQDLASILYTSGSTGTPKGIMHTHYSILSLAKLESQLGIFSEEDRIGSFAPLYFDQSLTGHFTGPLVGATTIFFPDSYIKLPASLTVLAAKERITLWYSVASILVQVLEKGDIDNQSFSSLGWVRFGGEVFPVKQLRELMQKWPHVKFINSYGPAELARCTFHLVKELPNTDEPIPIGKVWKNTEYKILDKNDKEVNKGESGELTVRTSTLMAGYWNNKKLTDKAFYTEEIAPGYNHIYYRTGDLVKENNKKELLFLGRIDRQIKLRGYRIELDEIENILLRNDHIKEAVVVVFKTDESMDDLAAAVRLREGSEIEPTELILFCKKHLQPYAIPSSITVLEKLPRTASGKINRTEIVKLIENQTS